MLTRRQQLTLGLLLTSIVFLYNVSTPKQIRSHSSNYRPLNEIEDIIGDEVLSSLTVPSEDQRTLITETKLPGNSPVAGFTIFDRLYVRNGTIYAVTTEPSTFPALKYILSKPKDMQGGQSLDPTPQDMQIISPDEAKVVLGEHAIVLEGMSFILWDTHQFMAHYYHWWGELILGAMRVYSNLQLVLGSLPEPRRFLLPTVPDQKWRDRAGLNGPLMRAAWPDTTIEKKDSWEDMIFFGQTFVFERAMIVSRIAAHKSPMANLWFKMIASSMNVTAPERFWEPLRQRVVRNALGYLPKMNDAGVVITSPRSEMPVVTYVSRQTTGRRLTDEAHEGLVEALRGLEDEGICKVNVAAMERLTFSQQIEMVSRSTVILGVHGNGLTHQLWMPPSPHSTVIEVFYPKTYVHDYEILARNMDHKHYAVWNDSTLTFPEGEWFKGVDYGNSSKFHGNEIYVHGPTVADLIRQRLIGRFDYEE